MPHVPLYVSERFRGRSKAGLYGDVVETIDWTMGQIFETLDRLELDERTIVLFTSDNGPWWEGSAGELRDRKGSSWEGGQRVPLVVRWPGSIPAGATTDAISMNIDLLPTLVNLAGGVLPDAEIDGRDILPLLQGGEASPHEYLLFFQKDRIAAVRSQRWKLVVESYYRSVRARIGAATYHHPPGLLFDLENDPTERYSFTREHMELALRMRGWIDDAYSKLVGGELEDLPVWAR
jgi:uncharacterized sulfatase